MQGQIEIISSSLITQTLELVRFKLNKHSAGDYHYHMRRRAVACDRSTLNRCYGYDSNFFKYLMYVSVQGYQKDYTVCIKIMATSF